MIIQEKRTVSREDWTQAIRFLDEHFPLSRSKLKDAMNKGCVWRTRRGERIRMRRAQTEIRHGDVIELFYNAEALRYLPKAVELIEDCEQYSVWNKPAGMPIAGDDWGDYNSLLRQVELMCQGERVVLAVQTLDVEATGVVVVAHQPQVAERLRQLFASGQVQQHYRAEVLGEIAESGTITAALDGQAAVTTFQRVNYNDYAGRSRVDAELPSGIPDQLRRHLEGIGHPVMGDALYGEGNDNRGGLRLRLTALAFTCPLRQQAVEFSLY